MRRYKDFNRLFLFTVLIIFVPLVMFSTHLEPLEGDLTRTGYYSENNFGWNSIQEKIDDGQIKANQEYDRYYDVVIIGDSFSLSGLWQSYFHQFTGLSVLTVAKSGGKDLNQVERFLDNAIYKAAPPRLVIYESVEREYVKNLDRGINNCQIAPTPTVDVIRITEAPFSAKSFTRLKHDSKLDLKPGYAANYLFNNMLRDFFNINKTTVEKFHLTRNDLFSNRLSDDVLIYKIDLLKEMWNSDQINSIACSLANIQNRVQSNGKTFFVFMPVPDKLTAYSKYIVNNGAIKKDIIDMISHDEKLHIHRLDKSLKKAIQAGVKDVYLPSNTHWGSEGHKIAAKTMVDYLKESGVIVQNRSLVIENIK